MTEEGDKQLCALGVIGVGNTLAGDDGAGNEVVSRLKRKYSGRDDILLHNLETDPLELWDILPRSRRFIFIDAVAGKPPGRLVSVRNGPRAYSPSLHQMDLFAVVEQLGRLGNMEDMEWSIWGVTIDIPDELREELSPEVSTAVDKLVEEISGRIESKRFEVEAPVDFEEFDDTRF